MMFLMRDRDTRRIVSHVVSVKSVDQEWVAEQLTCEIPRLGAHGGNLTLSERSPHRGVWEEHSWSSHLCWTRSCSVWHKQPCSQ